MEIHLCGCYPFSTSWIEMGSSFNNLVKSPLCAANRHACSILTSVSLVNNPQQSACKLNYCRFIKWSLNCEWGKITSCTRSTALALLFRSQWKTLGCRWKSGQRNTWIQFWIFKKTHKVNQAYSNIKKGIHFLCRWSAWNKCILNSLKCGAQFRHNGPIYGAWANIILCAWKEVGCPFKGPLWP